MDGRGQHINALVYPLIAHDLSSQEAECLPFKHHFHSHKSAARVVARMAHGRKNHPVHRQTGHFSVGLIHAGGSGGHVKDFDDTAALAPQIPAVPSADVVRCNPPLFVGGTSQRDHRIRSGDIVLHLNRIPHGVDVGDRSLHAVVDHNAPLKPQLQPRLSGQGGIWSNSNGQYHHVGVERGLVLKQHIHTAAALLKALHRAAQSQFDAMPAHLTVDKGRHIRVKGLHKLLGPLDDSDLYAQLPQIFRQLQPDKTATRQHGRPGPICPNVLLDAEGILHGAQGEHLFKPHAGQSGLGGLGAWGENQFVVGLLEDLVCLQIFDRDRFFVRVDGHNLMVHPHIHLEAGQKTLWGLEGQGLWIGDHIADIVGQSAVGIGDIPRPLKNNNLSLFVQSTNPSRCRGTPRHATYNYHFHFNTSCYSIASICFFGLAPAAWFVIFPFFITTRAGIPITPN